MIWIDLTMPLSEKTPVFPGAPPSEFRSVATVAQDGWNELRLAFNAHFGTHLDAPYHLLDDGKKLSDYPVDRFVGSAVVIDVRGQKEIRVNSSDLAVAGVKPGDFVFFLTGHSDGAFKPGYFEDNPVIPLDTAQALVDADVSLVGLDSFTPDNEPYDVHKLLFRHDVLILENLVDLAQLAGKRVDVVVAPLHILNGDGAPCRVFAKPI